MGQKSVTSIGKTWFIVGREDKAKDPVVVTIDSLRGQSGIVVDMEQEYGYELVQYCGL